MVHFVQNIYNATTTATCLHRYSLGEGPYGSQGKFIVEMITVNVCCGKNYQERNVPCCTEKSLEKYASHQAEKMQEYPPHVASRNIN